MQQVKTKLIEAKTASNLTKSTNEFLHELSIENGLSVHKAHDDEQEHVTIYRIREVKFSEGRKLLYNLVTYETEMHTTASLYQAMTQKQEPEKPEETKEEEKPIAENTTTETEKEKENAQ